MAGEDILAALQGIKSSPLENYYGIGAGMLGANTPNMINPYGSVGANLALTLGSVLGQGLLTNMAQEEAAKRSLSDAKLALALQGLSPEQRISQIEGADLGGLRSQRLLDVSNTLAARELATKQALQQQQELAKIQVDQALAEKYGVPFGQGAEAAQQQAKGLEQFKTSMPAEAPKYGDYKPLTAKKEERVQHYLAQGATANKALESAEQDVKPAKAFSEGVLKKANEARDRAAEASAIAATARSGMDKAGQTGGPPLWAALRGAASSIYQYVPTPGGQEEAQQRAATTELNSIQAKLVKMGRSPGSVSDKENAMLIGTGPSGDKTQAENEVLVKNIEVAADLDNQFANFMEDYVNDKGDSFGAQKLWEQYKKATVFRNGVINYDYPSFEDWWAEQKSGGKSAAIDQSQLSDEEIRKQIAEAQQLLSLEKAKRGL